MIARTWAGATRAADADAYLEYLHATGLAAYRPRPATAARWRSAGSRATGPSSCCSRCGNRRRRSAGSPATTSIARSSTRGRALPGGAGRARQPLRGRVPARRPRHESRRFRARLVGAFAAIYLMWGGTFLAIRYAVADVPPLMTMVLRCAGGAAVLFAWLAWRGTLAPRHRAGSGSRRAWPAASSSSAATASWRGPSSGCRRARRRSS